MTNISLENLSGQSDLDVRVFNPFGNLVVQDVSVAPNAFVSFYVPNPGTYRVEIRNFSGPGATYRLTAN
jgi:hypothetical protein